MMELAYETHEGLFGAIKKLIVLETLVAHAYRAVDDLIEDVETRARLRAFRHDHERNAGALTRWLCRLPGEAQDSRTEPQTCNEGMIGGLTPIMAMWLNEDEAARGYEELLERPQLDAGLERTLARGLEDARSHWAWLTLLVQPQAHYHATA